ncbi:DUF1501 domain-containing protein [Sandaracinobacteroides saxicola]|uniref:DUF1501 domain-containing protein n=1 Tax=Sandaracinobacteroides saxicola TaxID=2759707 RepID=A0A7G5II63_9SPHN|nr:DUF1501 domain-containing protein [Sandaracinobacteroides saxicola]QMW23055.1 DUF1501 domain-containing protein [Sandaracinobacteroides saxicola]
MISRRLLLGTGLAAGLLPGLAFAAAPTPRRFVFIILRGAMDGLDTVIPGADPGYAAARGALVVENPLPLPGGLFGLHPALAQTAALAARGQAGFVHAVASPYRDRSHFDGQDVLESGAAAVHALRDGWMNRLTGALAGSSAVAIAPVIPLALKGPANVTSYAPSNLPDAQEALLSRVTRLYAADPLLHPLWSEALSARTLASGMADPTGNRAEPQALAKIAATFLAQANGPRLATLEIGGWDTHSGQKGRLANQLRQLDGAIAALASGLGPLWADTLVLAATEFGRTVAVNGTGGTDHGTGGAALVAGGGLAAFPRLSGRVLADWPGLAPAARFEGRDLRPTTDLRALILTLAAGHFAQDPARLARQLFPDAPPPPLTL